MGAPEGREPSLWVHRDTHKNTSKKPLTGKSKGVNFHDFLQPAGFKDWSLEIGRLGWETVLRVLPYSWIEDTQATLGVKVHGKRLYMENNCERWYFQTFLSGDKNISGHYFPPLPLSIGAETLAEDS